MSDATNKTRAKNLNYLRSSNAGAVIRLLLTSDQVTRQILAQNLNLTKMSISYIVNDLIEKGIVCEQDIGSPQTIPGRRPNVLKLCQDSLYALGVYISRDYICSSLVNVLGVVQKSIMEHIDSNISHSMLISIIHNHVQHILDSNPDLPVIGIGVASIGLVNSGSARIHALPDFNNTEQMDLQVSLSQLTSLPIFALNDMKAAALAELYYGAGKIYSDFVYLGITNGIGAGVVFNNKLFEGHDGYSSEIGHMSIQRNGPECVCGNRGCLELYTKIPHLVEKSGCQNWESLLSNARCNQQPAASIVCDFCNDIGLALTNISNIFNPQAVIIGHEGSLLDSEDFEILQRHLDKSSMTRNNRHVKVVRSEIQERITQISGAVVIFYQMFHGRIPVV